jgi:hypothetical protein
MSEGADFGLSYLPTMGFSSILLRATDRAQAHRSARDIRILTRGFSHDVLALAGPALATRQELFDRHS